MNQIITGVNQDAYTIEVKPNGLVISVLILVVGVLLLIFAIFDKKADSDTHKFAIGLGIFRPYPRFCVFAS